MRVKIQELCLKRDFILLPELTIIYIVSLSFYLVAFGSGCMSRYCEIWYDVIISIIAIEAFSAQLIRSWTVENRFCRSLVLMTNFCMFTMERNGNCYYSSNCSFRERNDEHNKECCDERNEDCNGNEDVENHDKRMTLEAFLKVIQPGFKRTLVVMEANKWFRCIEKSLQPEE
ncbi:hypothetical protein AHAS_Ahas05G0167600 [Arachis hypogaea]